MKTLRDILGESLDSKPKEVSWYRVDKHYDSHEDSYVDSHWNHRMYADIGTKHPFKANFTQDDSGRPGHYNFDFSAGGTYFRTGEGNQQRIMSAALHSLKDFHQNQQPNWKSIGFTANKADAGASRAKLYGAMLRKHAEKHGLEVEHHESSRHHAWTLTKKGVNESLDKPGSLHWETGGRHLDFKRMMASPDYRDHAAYSRVGGRDFNAHFNHGADSMGNPLEPGHYEYHFNVDGVHGKTGEGHQQRVMATALHAIKEFHKRQPNWKSIRFTAMKSPEEWSGSRKRLYSAMVKKHAEKHGLGVVEHDHHNETIWKLTQKPVNESMRTSMRMRDYLGDRDTQEDSPEIQHAIRTYKSGLGFSMNKALRDGKDEKGYGPEVYRNHVEALDKLTNEKSLDRSMHVYRGISNFDPQKHSVGSEHVDKAFTSTSLNANLAKGHARAVHSIRPDLSESGRPAVMKIHLPRGTRGHYLDTRKRYTEMTGHHPESEFLLSRGGRFKVTRHEEHPVLGTVVHAKLVGQGEV